MFDDGVYVSGEKKEEKKSSVVVGKNTLNIMIHKGKKRKKERERKGKEEKGRERRENKHGNSLFEVLQ